MQALRAISFLTAFFISNGLLCLSYCQVSGKWSGTITERSQVTGQPGVVSESVVSINYNENVGTGTYEGTGILTVEGKVLNRTSCRGTGTVGFAELTIDNIEKTYTIQTAALIYTCQHSGGDSDSGEAYITIAYEPWDENPRVLRGSKTQVTDIPGGGKLTTFTSWNLVKDSDVELIVKPLDYDNWLPEPGSDESTPGRKMLSIELKLLDRNGQPANEKADSFELRLVNTSKEKGIAMNMPSNPSQNQLPDLRFQPQQGAAVKDDGQVMTIYCPGGCLTANFKIASYDGGGWSTLNATAKLKNGQDEQGKLLTRTGATQIEIPKRDPGSMIAKAWADLNGNPFDGDDKEEKDPHAGLGDGFSAYEEYRGFISEGVFKRLDPRKKELAVRVKVTERSLFSEGITWFETASKIKVIRFLIHEVANDRRINFNSGHAHDYDQYALKLDKGNLPSDKAGKAFTTSGLPDIPANTTQVIIATANISRNFQQWSAWAQSNNLRLPWTEREYLANTVSHELGHGAKVWHHGDNANAPQGETAQQGGSPVYHIFDRNSNEITTRPYIISDRVCPASSSQTSGDLHCVMAYIDVCDWARIAYADGSIGLFQTPLLAVGKNFCTLQDGTDINAGFHVVSGVSYPNYFGKAEKGKCLGQISLR